MKVRRGNHRVSKAKFYAPSGELLLELLGVALLACLEVLDDVLRGALEGAADLALIGLDAQHLLHDRLVVRHEGRQARLGLGGVHGEVIGGAVGVADALDPALGKW